MQVDQERLREYEDCQKSLHEIEELLQENPEDEDTLELASDARSQLQRLAAALDAPAAHFIVDDKAVGCRVEGSNPMNAEAKHMVLPYDPSSRIDASLVYEVLFDNTAWYSCVVLQKLSPRTSEGRVKFRVHLLGYNIEEVVVVDCLRLWQAPEGPSLASKMQCHAVHCSGWWYPCVVDRLTPHGTIIVTFEQADLKEGRVVELPPSYLRVGRFYRTLIKKHTLTEEEKRERAAQAALRKRDRQGMVKQRKVDVAQQNQSDWKGLQAALLGEL